MENNKTNQQQDGTNNQNQKGQQNPQNQNTQNQFNDPNEQQIDPNNKDPFAHTHEEHRTNQDDKRYDGSKNPDGMNTNVQNNKDFKTNKVNREGENKDEYFQD